MARIRPEDSSALAATGTDTESAATTSVGHEEFTRVHHTQPSKQQQQQFHHPKKFVVNLSAIQQQQQQQQQKSQIHGCSGISNSVEHCQNLPSTKASTKPSFRDNNWKSKLAINLTAGTVITLSVLAALAIFVVVPQMNQQHAADARIPHTLSAAEHGPSVRHYDAAGGAAGRRYEWPPPSYSLMGKFRRAAITSDHGICSEMGRNVMLRGGNAVDASIAALVCLGVTNPQSSGLGGGFIMTLYNRTTRSCKVVDARETAPRAAHRDMYGSDEWASKYGYRAIATPSELAGYWLAHREFGSGRIPWSELLRPSVELARNGVPVSEYLAHVLDVKENHFRTLPSMRGWINPVTNKTYQFGDVIHRHQLADTMEKLAHARDPVELFYHGEMADTIVREIQANGGLLTKADLMAYRPKVYDHPLLADVPLGVGGGYGDDTHAPKGSSASALRMCGPPPPSSFAVTQSIIAVMVARFSDHEREGNEANRRTVLDDTEFYHWLIEAEKFAYAQRTRLGDADFVPEALQLARNMSGAAFTKWILERVPRHAQPSAYYSDTYQMAQKPDHGTSHVSVLDSEGNGVSATSTVNRWFGAVVQSEALGIVWNDEMDDFSTPGMRNGFGFAPSPANFIAPGKRPMSSMSPMVMYNTRTGNLKFVIGASGGSKIISATAKPIIRVLCFNETIKEAIDAPTLHNQFTPDETQYESTVPKLLLTDLETKFGQKFRLSSGFEGIVQGIHVADDGFIYANGDFRRRSNMHPEGF